jgi:membrane protein implicated in regulation of membrane protease activity
MALGGSIAVAVFLIAVGLARNDFVSTATKKSLNGQTAGIIFDTLLRYLKDGLWISLVVLLALSVILWFVGRRSRRARTADTPPTVEGLPEEAMVP